MTRIFSILLLLASSCNALAAQEKVSPLTHLLSRAPVAPARWHGPAPFATPPPTKVMLMLFDESEKDLKGNTALTSTTITALSQRAAPLLVSGSLLQTIQKGQEQRAALGTEWPKSMADKQARAAFGSDKEIANLLALDTIDFSQWLVFKINDFLFLLVPINMMPRDPGRKDRESGMTERELTIGLQVDHLEYMRPISSADLISHLAKLEKLAQAAPFAAQNYLLYGMFTAGAEKNRIFVTRADYGASNQLDRIPQWTFYVSGHGSIKGHVAGLTLPAIKRLLDSFETKLLTRLLIIVSCYAAGENVTLVYRDFEKSIPKQYSFPIIMEGGSDLPAYVPGISFGFAMQPVFHIDFTTFAAEISRPEPIPYKNLLKSLFSTGILSSNISELSEIHNLPTLRPADRDKFVPFYTAIEIDTIMAATRTSVLPIKQMARTKRGLLNRILVFINTPLVPFTLNITGLNRPLSILSGMPGSAKHRLRGLITDLSIEQIASLFKAEYGTSKEFFIAEIFRPTKGLPIAYTNVYIKLGCGPGYCNEVIYKEADDDSEARLIDIPFTIKEKLFPKVVGGAKKIGYTRSLLPETFFGEKEFLKIQAEHKNSRAVQWALAEQLQKRRLPSAGESVLQELNQALNLIRIARL